MNILTVLARYGTAQYADAEARIDDLFARQLPGVGRFTVVVENQHDGDPDEPAVIEARPDRVLLAGDNRSYEFSAFDRAVAFMGERLDQYDLIHFATSAFHTLYVAYLERFTTPLVAAIGQRPVAVGHIDCYNEPVTLRGCVSQHWIRSGFFMLPPREVRLLGRFADLPDGAPFFSGRAKAPFRQDAPLSAAYQRYILDWLTGRDIGQGVEWHSSFGLTAATLPAFERKARSIMTEQWLGIRLRAAGCALVDVTWLSAQLRGTSAERLNWRTPWRQQLAGRDRDAIVVPPTV